MFSVRDPIEHSELRRPVASKFSMSAIKTQESFADDCIDIFSQSMKDLEGQTIDLGEWVQWYAFDVIAAITFNRRFGFMEERQDIGHMIGDIESVLRYSAIIGQIPEWHRWLMGNKWFVMLLTIQPFFRVPNPFQTIVEVSTCLSFSLYPSH